MTGLLFVCIGVVVMFLSPLTGAVFALAIGIPLCAIGILVCWMELS